MSQYCKTFQCRCGGWVEYADDCVHDKERNLWIETFECYECDIITSVWMP